VPLISDEQLEALQKDHNDLADLRADTQMIHALLVSAARFGFTNKNQEDAIIFALMRITKEPREVIKLTLHINPKGYHGR
jgi:hypothetical protein